MSHHRQQQHQRMIIRQRRRRISWATLVMITAAAARSIHAKFVKFEKGANREDEEQEKKCSIYIAPSSLLGNSGFGVYTTRDINAGEAILSGPPGTPDGPALTVVDPGAMADQKHREQWNNVFGHYWWGRGVAEHATYEAQGVVDFQITFGALPNHHCLLGSLEMVFPLEDAYDDSMTNRFESPGAGAYSYNTGRIFYATHDLKAGSELFLSYGYCSRKEKESPEPILWYPKWTQYIPMEEDFQIAGVAARSMWSSWLRKTASGRSEDIPDGVPLNFDDKDNLFLPPLAPHARSLLPNTTTELKQAMAASSSPDRPTDEQFEELKRYMAREFGTTPRTPEWVEEYGLCIEHLIPGPSTLPHAGHGAFAQHFIGKGEMVVPVPLLHITHKEVLHLPDEEGQSTHWQQLLTNYCFSHPGTTLALCPTSNAILLNHCSSRTKQCGPDGPNAKIQWASPDWDPRTEKWLNATVDEMEDQLDRLLAMEVVATRDIHPGDEVFIDYGEAWEVAWQTHVDKWEPDHPEEADSYFSIAEANRNVTAPLKYLVSERFRDEVDHPYIFTACLYWPSQADYHEVYHHSTEIDFEAMSDQEIFDQYSDDGSMYRGEYYNPSFHNQNYWPCSVLFQDNDPGDEEVTYLVRIMQHPAVSTPMPWSENDLPRFLYYYPRSSIRYFVKPYLSDQFLYGAFRQFIGIHDDMFPESWRNLPAKDQGEEATETASAFSDTRV